MRALFIDPPAPLKPRKGAPGMNINLGIATLTPILLEEGHQVALYDMVNHYECRDISGITKCLEEFKPDVLLVPILNAQYDGAMEVIKALKAQTGLPVIVGGPEAAAVKGRVFPDSDHMIDYLALGEAEESLPAILRNLENGTPEKCYDIPGLFINKDGEVTQTGDTQMIANMDKFPGQKMDIFGLKSLRSYKVIASRGCPFKCNFCFQYLGQSWRGRDPQRVIEEIREAKEKYNIQRFRFVDPLFNWKVDWTIDLCNAIKNSDIRDIPWEAGGIRADKLTDEVCAAMADAGCDRISVGVETLQPDVFRLIKKSETLKQINSGLRTALKYFPSVQAFMIIGLPGDTYDRTMYSYKEARKIGPRDKFNLAYSMAVPYNATRMMDWVKENARMFGDSHQHLTRSELVVDHGVSYETDDFTAEERIRAYKVLNTKERAYVSRHKSKRYMTPLLWLRDALKYDAINLPGHLLHIGKFTKKVIQTEYLTGKEYKTALITESTEGTEVAEIRDVAHIEYDRVPDGTWWLG